MKKPKKYNIATPIPYDELKSKIPEGEAVPAWRDNECCLVCCNIFGSLRYISPNGKGEFEDNTRIPIYLQKLNPEYIVETREYIKGCYKRIDTVYGCPNCGEDLAPYDYNYKNIFWTGMRRQKFCPECGYPLLWY